MRIGIASNLVMDDIITEGLEPMTRLGGPPCYCGLTARKFKLGVTLASNFGPDFEDRYLEFLKDAGIDISFAIRSKHPTTRFALRNDKNGERLLTLKSKCSEIQRGQIESQKVDGWLISPVLDEVQLPILDILRSGNQEGNFLMLDPQGYLRSSDSFGNVSITSRSNLDFTGINAIKVDPQELAALTGGLAGLDGMKWLNTKGVESVLSTEHLKVSLLHKKTLYWMDLKEVATTDTTGAGDILAAAFMSAFLKENDSLWAFCFGTGALIAALETGGIGLDKIPSMSRIEQNASYFYNLIGFRKL
jgi:sugar/nucleoside kinase (ribokinase family)